MLVCGVWVYVCYWSLIRIIFLYVCVLIIIIIIPESEGFMAAIQAHVILTKNYRKYIIKNTSDCCRKCNSSPETTHHGECKSIAQMNYK